MFLSHLAWLPVAFTLASPTGIATRDNGDSDYSSDLLLRYHHEAGSNQTELTLSTSNKEVIAHACGTSFDVNGQSISFQVNARGSGDVSIGDKSYKVLGNRDMSGGISCTKMYNSQSTVVECSVPWSTNSDLKVLSSNEVEECFSAESAARRRSLPDRFGNPLLVDRSTSGLSTSQSTEMEKRQMCIVTSVPMTSLVGDGDPHQDYLHKQVGPSQQCAQRGSCFVGVGEEVSISITAEIGGAGPWISAGFGVSFTKSSSTERGCYGEPGDTVCQWSKTHHTAYTVITETYTQMTTCKTELTSTSDPYVIRSPNDNSMAIEWYCVLNTCRGDGDRYWELGRAGTA